MNTWETVLASDAEVVACRDEIKRLEGELAAAKQVLRDKLFARREALQAHKAAIESIEHKITTDDPGTRPTP